MATRWDIESWRKLYLKRNAQWLGLDLSARGLGDELLKYADDQGRLFKVNNGWTASDIATHTARTCSAKPHEYRRIASDVRQLLEDTYLQVQEEWLTIRNFIPAQEKLSPEARRKRKQRERDNERDMSRDHVTHPSVTGESNVTLIRSESIRVEEEEKTNARARVMGVDLDHVPGPVVEQWKSRSGVRTLSDSALLAVWECIAEYAAEVQKPWLEVLPQLFDGYERVTAGWDSSHRWVAHLFVKHFDVIQGEVARPSSPASNGVGSNWLAEHNARVARKYQQ